MGLHSQRDNWFQPGALADSTELRYPENKIIYFEQIPKPLQRIFYARDSYLAKRKK